MDSVLQRTLRSLAASYAFMWAGLSLVAGPGSQALVHLTGNLSYAGLFVAVVYLAAAAAAAVAGRLMDQFGRRPILIGAHVVGAVGYALAGRGVAVESLLLFVVGTAVFSMAFGAGNLTRVAVAEMFPPQIRGRGMASVQLSATIGAVAGPSLLLASVPLAAWLGQSPLVLVWYVAPPLLLLAAVSSARGVEPLTIARDLPRYHGDLAALGAMPSQPSGAARSSVVLAGMVALASSHAAMATLMGVAGAAVAHAGYGTHTLGFLMLVHFVGMFGLSRQVGRVADGFGRRNTVFIGLGLLGLGGIMIALNLGQWGFGAGLLLAGLGWSFGYIGGTLAITDASLPQHRARSVGRADLVAQLSAAVVATAGGFWFAQNGLSGLGFATAILALAAAVGVFALLRSQTAEATAGRGPQDGVEADDAQRGS